MAQAAPAPLTGHHDVTSELRDEALALFFDMDTLLPNKPTTGGVNNVVQYGETKEGERFVLRIYNNGNKSEKVVFEHEVRYCMGMHGIACPAARMAHGEDRAFSMALWRVLSPIRPHLRW